MWSSLFPPSGTRGSAAVTNEDALEHLDVVDDARHVERKTSGLAEPTEEGVFLVLSRVPPSPIWVVRVTGFQGPDNLELVGVVLIHERDGYAHDAAVIAGDCVGKGNFYRIVVFVPAISGLSLDLLVFAEPQVVLHGHERQFLM